MLKIKIVKLKIFLSEKFYKLQKKEYKAWKRIRGHAFSFNFFGRTIFRNWIIKYLMFTNLITFYYLHIVPNVNFIHYYLDFFLIITRWFIDKLNVCWYYIMDFRIMRYVLAGILLWIFWLSIKYLTF